MYYPLRKKKLRRMICNCLLLYSYTGFTPVNITVVWSSFTYNTVCSSLQKKKGKKEQKLFNVKSKRPIEWKACLSDWSLMGFMEQSIVRSWTPSLVSCKISLYPKPGSFLIVLISLARLLAKSLREGYVCIGRLALIPNLKTNNICITDQ